MLLTISGLRSKVLTRGYGVHVGVPGGIEFDFFVRNFLFKHGPRLRTLCDGCIPVLLPQKTSFAESSSNKRCIHGRAGNKVNVSITPCHMSSQQRVG